MTEIAYHWNLHVDVGPAWLFFRFGKTSRDADPNG
jgi:hypothetical protein